MARERYLLDAGEDTIHQNVIKAETPKEKRKNWWFYHKGHVVAGVIAAALVFSLFYSIFSKVQPDYTVALLTSYTMPECGKDELERCMGAYAEDRNGDGKTIVAVVNYVFSDTAASSPELLEQRQATMARFVADCATNDSMIFLYEDKAFRSIQVNLDGFFQYNDGTAMPEGAEDFENAALAWEDFQAFSSFAPEPNDENFTGEILLELFEKLKVSVRTAEGSSIQQKEKYMRYYEDSMEFYQRLKDGIPVSTGEGS